MGKVAIHGFGRIGRSITKVALKNNLFTPVSVSDIRDIPTFAALFEVDSNYGRWHEQVKATEKGFVIGNREIPYYNSMQELPDWSALGVDLVVDCTGRATTRAGAQAHLDRGAKRVLVSAPRVDRSWMSETDTGVNNPLAIAWRAVSRPILPNPCIAILFIE